MPNHQDHLRHIFDGLVETPPPTAQQALSAQRALSAALNDDRPPQRQTHRRLIAVAVAAVLAVVLVLTPVTPWSRAPADALLTELAFATRDIAAQEMPEGSYVYVVTDQLALGDAGAQVEDEFVYLQLILPTRTEAWWQGETVQLETTVGRPVFFSQEDEEFYYANDLDKADSVGETTTQFLTNVTNQPDPGVWSTDVEQLALQLRQDAEANHGEAPIDVKIVEAAERLLTPHLVASPALRAAILEVLSTLDLDEETRDDGGVTASITYEDGYFGTVTKRLTFDAAGYLIHRESITLTGDVSGALVPGTAYVQITQTPPVAVSEPGARPGE